MVKRIFIIALCGACIYPIGCGNSQDTNEETASEPSEVKELLAAPQTVTIQGITFALEAELWRDFMPISPPEGKPLAALVMVTAAGTGEFPPSLLVDRLWVIHGQEVWETEFSGEKIPLDPAHRNQLKKMARGGPKWGPGIEVDVVVRIVDSSKNTTFLRVSNIMIKKTT
jgi:hypothetical protein